MALVAGGLVVFSVINLYERQDLPALLSCNNWAQYSPGDQEQQEQDDEEGGEVDEDEKKCLPARDSARPVSPDAREMDSTRTRSSSRNTLTSCAMAPKSTFDGFNLETFQASLQYLVDSLEWLTIEDNLFR